MKYSRSAFVRSFLCVFDNESRRQISTVVRDEAHCVGADRINVTRLSIFWIFRLIEIFIKLARGNAARGSCNRIGEKRRGNAERGERTITTVSVTFDVAPHIILRRPRDFCCEVIDEAHVEFPRTSIYSSIAVLSVFRHNRVSKILHIFQHD